MKRSWARTSHRLTVEAPAKINLHLEVVGRRPDGYHELVTVLHAVELCDTLHLQARPRRAELPAARADVTLTLECEGDLPRLDTVPPGEDNLATRAACAWLAAAGLHEAFGLTLRLVKRIPPGSGLGGGSSDAAAVLRGLQELLGPRLDEESLATLAATLGSDVPFFLRGGTALCTGRGEHVLPVTPPAALSLVLAFPPFGVPTPAVYGALRAPELARAAPDARTSPPVRHRALLEALAGASPDALEALVRNDLSEPARRVEPRLRPLLDRPGAHLCGSGSAVFFLGASPPLTAPEREPPSIRFVTTRSKNR